MLQLCPVRVDRSMNQPHHQGHGSVYNAAHRHGPWHIVEQGRYEQKNQRDRFGREDQAYSTVSEILDQVTAHQHHVKYAYLMAEKNGADSLGPPTELNGPVGYDQKYETDDQSM